MKTFIRMIKDEAGASAAEYALILAVVGVGIIVAAIALGGAVGNSMNCAAQTINTRNVGASC
ncbi:MAG TPA: Flp family type IVb pilin [Sphingomicrobium sp.]|nr:Flp family type IVb pilin [Sphingomicrobium sp.]